MTAIKRNLCVLFAYVAGSTRVYEKLGDAEALLAIGRCMERIEGAVLASQGRVIKTIGDEIMAVFDTVDAGMLAATGMQKGIDDLSPVAEAKMAIRVGFHFGPAIDDTRDIFGDTVNVASRLAGLAKASQIVTTETCVALMSESLRQFTRDIDALTVKGKGIDLRVHEVIWRKNDELTMKPASVAPPAADARLWLRHGTHELLLSTRRPAITLGRDQACDIPIRDQRASRNHGKIECRGDTFVLIDNSTNGTYVRFQGEPEFLLKREETILRGRGRIVFGHPWKSGADDTVEFEVESG